MRTAAVLCVLVALGCGKSDRDGAEMEPPEKGDRMPVAVHPSALSEAYTVNPAAADAKYKGKWVETKMPWLQMEQRDGKSQVRAGRLVYRFAEEAEAAKVEGGKVYRVVGRCDGLSGEKVMVPGFGMVDELVISRVRVKEEWKD